MDIEKNDVSISSLFKWNTEVSILGPRGEELKVLYLRLVGDADINKARVFSLRESARLRKQLKTSGTDEYEAYISQIKDQDKEVLIKLVILYQIPKFGEESRKEVDIKFPTEPSSNTTQEEHENYQKEIDEFPTKFANESEKILKKKLTKEEKRLEALDEIAIRKEYIDAFINFMCQQEMVTKFNDMCIFLGAYRDKKFKHHAFIGWDEYNNAAPELKDQLRKAYTNLEITMPEIKKLQEATQSQPLGALPKDNG